MNPEIQRLIDQLHDPDTATRVRAAAALGQFGAANEDTTGLADHGLAALIEALDDPERDVRWEAVYALGALGETAALPALLDAYARWPHDSGLRLVIIKGLGKLGHPDAVPHLTQTLRGSDSLCMQVASRKALERIATPEAQAAIAAWEEHTP